MARDNTSNERHDDDLDELHPIYSEYIDEPGFLEYLLNRVAPGPTPVPVMAEKTDKTAVPLDVGDSATGPFWNAETAPHTIQDSVRPRCNCPPHGVPICERK